MRLTPSAAILLVLAAGCRCEEVTRPSVLDLRVSTEHLSFGPTNVGTNHSLPIVITNGSNRLTSVEVDTAAPFEVDAHSVRLAAGAQLELEIQFSPQASGSALGALHITAEEWTATVQLDGLGVECSAPSPCEMSDWSEASRSCITTIKANGTSCRTACLVAALCVDGQCLGQARDCDDANACTADSCVEDAGCLHADTSAECGTQAGECLAAACEPDAGCIVRSVEDGVACSSPCVPVGQCSGGSCIGASRECGDSDACTRDWCDIDAGCQHVDESASCTESTNPCEVAVCLSDAGCGFSNVADGTHCRPSTCSASFVCQSGACVNGPPPPVGPCGCSDWGTDAPSTLSAGGYHNCRVTNMRTVECWGRNLDGEIGDGTLVLRPSPVTVPGLIDVVL